MKMIIDKIVNHGQLTTQDYKLLEETFVIYNKEIYENNNLIVVNLDGNLYAFRVNYEQKDNPVYLDHPYQVSFIEKDNEIYVVEYRNED